MAINLCITYTEVVVIVSGWILYRQMSSYRSILCKQWTSAPCGASVYSFQGMERYSDILLHLIPGKYSMDCQPLGSNHQPYRHIPVDQLVIQGKYSMDCQPLGSNHKPFRHIPVDRVVILGKCSAAWLVLPWTWESRPSVDCLPQDWGQPPHSPTFSYHLHEYRGNN